MSSIVIFFALIGLTGSQTSDLNKQLLKAVVTGRTVEVQALLAEGANANTLTDEGLTALALASARGHEAIVRDLLAHDAKVDVRTLAGVTPLLSAAQYGHAGTVVALLEAGADVHAVRENGRTALMLAAASGDTDTLRVLLEAGANIEAKSKSGWTALTVARLYNHTDITNVLKEVGARDSISGKEKVFDHASSGSSCGGEPYPFDGVEKRPTLRHREQPSYTGDALERKVEGSVTLEIIIQTDGTVGSVRIVKSLEVGLDLNGIEAVRKWSFSPGTVGDQAVCVIAVVEVSFKLL